jgi:hypothetical protein
MAQHYVELAKQAAHKMWPHVDYLARLVEGEAPLRRDRATKSRMRLARFPVSKTVEQFRWDWPTRMHRLQVQNHFHLEWIQAKATLIFLGGVGLGKTPLATAVGYTACLQGYSVLFASAIEVLNTLPAAKSAGRLKQELRKYTKPALLILDVRIPRISATQSTGRLPPNPYEACHPIHGKVATQSTAKLPPHPGHACHRRSTATPGGTCLLYYDVACQLRLAFEQRFLCNLGRLMMTGPCEKHVRCFPAWGPADNEQAPRLQGAQTLADIALVARASAHQVLMTTRHMPSGTLVIVL